ncbi:MULTISPECIES: aspartate/glutamate racemase family protein [Chelativorans]|jgi:arylmalonate decarboxylase|uniref:Asp/Glu racemase n=1 Tax=Chelativorans sp. (strain BNC1) TaxID=266779 RepID=Q11DV3_CHESB|nr:MULTISPECIES: aspartate/glutamate racemase family protein [Chelativorans]
MSAEDPVIGLIVPPAAGLVPPEAVAMYPEVTFHASGLGLKEMTPCGYAGVIDLVGDHAERHAQAGAQAVALMGTSLSFFRGAAFNAELITHMSNRSGLPATTMSQAVVDELKSHGARRIAVVTAYRQDVNNLLAAFLNEHGIEARSLKSLGITSVADVAGTPAKRLLQLCKEAVHDAGPVDAVLISCGGLHTLDVIVDVEISTGLPVVTSATAGVRGAVGLLKRSAETAEHATSKFLTGRA